MTHSTINLKKSFFFVFLLISVSACRSPPPGDPEIIDKGTKEINLSDTVNHPYSLESVIDSVDCINLESTVSSTLAEISKAIYKNERFYILDRKYQAVKVFSKTGKYLFDLGRLGTTKGAYLKLTDIVYNPLHNSMVLMCNTPDKMMEFTLDGKFISEKNMNFYASHIAIESPNRRYFYVNQNESGLSGTKNLLVTDTNNYILKRHFDFPEHVDYMVDYSGGIFSTNNQAYFNPPFTNIFYLLTGGKAIATYRVNFGKRNLPVAFNHNISISKEIHDHNFLTPSFSKIKNMVSFGYMDNTFYKIAFFNEQTGHIATNDVHQNNANAIFAFSIFNTQSDFITPLDTRHMKDWIQKNKVIKNRFPIVYYKLISKKTSDNPSLIIFKLRNF